MAGTMPTYKFGMDSCLSIKNMPDFIIPQPEDPSEHATRTEIRIWVKRVHNYVKIETILMKI